MGVMPPRCPGENAVSPRASSLGLSLEGFTILSWSWSLFHILSRFGAVLGGGPRVPSCRPAAPPGSSVLVAVTRCGSPAPEGLPACGPPARQPENGRQPGRGCSHDCSAGAERPPSTFQAGNADSRRPADPEGGGGDEDKSALNLNLSSAALGGLGQVT